MVAIVIVAAIAIALHVAARALETHVERLLGPDSEVAAVAVGWSAIEIRDVRIKAPKGWPVDYALRARRVVVAPDLRGLLSARLRIRRIDVEDAYVSAVRGRDGRVRLVPGLLESGSARKREPSAPLSIGVVEIRHGVLELFDAAVRQPAHRIRLQGLAATVEHLSLPDLAGRTHIALSGEVKGARRDGTLAIRGWLEPAQKNGMLAMKLRGADLAAFEPYLVTASDARVRRGTLDLALDAAVKRNVLRAPGTLTLTELELASGPGALSTFMGAPREAVMAALRDRDGRIAVRFTLEGNLGDPRFSLDESLARRMASSLADTLGVSVQGLAQGVGNAARGVGGAVMRLFGQ